LALDLGEPQTALTIADRALRQIAADPTPKYLELREERANALAGMAHLVMDDAKAALPQLSRAVALAETHLDPQRSPHLADTLIALAEALRRTGQYKAARGVLARAQAILGRHPALAGKHRKKWDETRKQLVAQSGSLER